ncbi:MAG: hypothetical protein N2317_03140 [Syntrophales bacterium]|nr:hypothetical protein [Syntrophales bacterium]
MTVRALRLSLCFGFVFTLLLLRLIGCDTTYGAGVKEGDSESIPITVTSDKMEVFEKDQAVIFTGNAQAIHGDRILRAESISLFYRKKSQEKKVDIGLSIESGAELERIVAKGKVRLINDRRLISGDTAIYIPGNQVVEVTGNALMWDGENVIKGDKITFYLGEKRGKVEAFSNDRRVTAVLIPSKREGVRGFVR